MFEDTPLVKPVPKRLYRSSSEDSLPQSKLSVIEIFENDEQEEVGFSRKRKRNDMEYSQSMALIIVLSKFVGQV
ncbi:hypothetical protein HDV06_004996 [Boothiomyces sp. JEL0866]|nr:hypothetical protein HDV06_004996 [Boothiomyces sp. JEL0866]